MAKQDISVRQLVDKVLSGELSLPEMQRRYVWTSTKVRDLLDSLYRGYPSGAILVWETDNVQDNRDVQISGINKTPFSTKLLLLDGQQRLTSLTAVISGKPIVVRNKQRPIEILFNLEHPENEYDETEIMETEDDDSEDSMTYEDNGDDELEEDEDEPSMIMEELRKRAFVVSTKSLKNDPRWISVSDIFTSTDSKLLKPLKIDSENDKWDFYSRRINNVRKIVDYQYVMQILDRNLPYEEVTEIFVRVNSLGVKLRGSDLALAQITSRWKGFLKELEKFSAQFKGNDEYLHDTGIMVKTLISFATGQSKYKTVARIGLQDLQDAWVKTQKGLMFAINLIRNNVRAENLNLLSSPFLLIPIAQFAFKKNEQLSEADQKKLLLWFYVAHMKGRYSRGSSETLLDSDLNVLKQQGDLDQLLSILKLQVREFNVSEEDLVYRNRRSPLFTFLFFILKQNGVKDWFNGIAVSEKTAGSSHALQFHHIFPKALLKKSNYETKEINEIANLAFIGGKTNRKISMKEPSDYLEDIIQNFGEQVLSSQLIPMERELWKVENFRQFLSKRRSLIANALNSYVNELSKF
ncbi:MAG: DUF262 domain-containing protein [Ignavibacteria bacterium]|nr:DUF262 domain-containing protein [Ignavibacteria bacterium]